MIAATSKTLPHESHEDAPSHVEGSLTQPSGPARREGHPPPRKPARLGRFLFIALLLMGGALAFGLIPRLKQRHAVEQDTKALSEPAVAVVSPVPAKAGAPLALSGELKPVMEASILARVNGYVREWTADLGARVKAGDVLAVLDTPEADRELSQARAQLVQAEAARDLAGTTAKRWKEMLSARTVSPQEADEKAGDLRTKEATVEAARANVQRLEQVYGFARITAPFDGTITQRAIDVGQLVNANGGLELYRLAQTDKLRVFVRVPQNYARGTTVGQTAELSLPELPEKKFEAKVVRTAGALDAATRTLLTELEVDNTKGEILAGSYAQVRLTESKLEANLTLPSNTILFRAEGTQVAVLENNKVAFRNVALGRDFGSAVEVREGITKADRVVVNPSDTLAAGTTVKVVEGQK